MKKILTALFSLFILSACATLNLSGNSTKIPSSYDTLLKNTETKKITYICQFDSTVYEYPTCFFAEKFEQGSSETSNVKVDDLDYVSFFISFNYQNNKVLANDYIMNLFRSYEKDKKNIQLEYISEMFNPVKRNFYDEETKNLLSQKMMFDNLQPSSFVTKYDNSISIFLSKKDIFLRNEIYPSLKIKGVTTPADAKYFSESNIQYLVFPHLFDTKYSSDWLATYLGVPSIIANEKNIEEMTKYFKDIEKNKDEIVDHSTSKLLASEKARPFVFENKIEKVKRNNPNSSEIFPLINYDDDHFINEYLPKYVLEKIEIIKKSGNEEKVVKTYNKANISELLISNEDIAGFAHRLEKDNNDVIIVRYTHNVDKPRYQDQGLFRLRSSGLESIYNKLRKTIVTDMVISKPYELKNIPYDCIEKAGVKKFLKKSGLDDTEINKYLSLFTNKTEKCLDSEIFMTKVIFQRDFRD